jgi:GMP synthase-like glutamine amidotransferase
MILHMLEHDTYAGLTNIDLWANQNGHQVERSFLGDGADFPDPQTFDWLVITGCFGHAWDEENLPWLKPEKEYVRRILDLGVPVLGLCFGAQVLAEILGGRLFVNEEPEIGWHQILLTSEGTESSLFSSVPELFATFHWHNDHFSLPPDCTRLAESDVSPNQAFMSTKYPALGIQFHPEYTLDLVRTYARDHGHEWAPGPYVMSRSEVLEKASHLPDTYWLMEAICTNWEQMHSDRGK